MAPKLQSEFFDELFTVSTRTALKLDFLPPFLQEDPLLELLLQNPQDFSSIKVADSVPLSELIQRHIVHKKVNYPNRETLGPEFTDEDYATLCERIERHHYQFQDRMVKDVEVKVEKFKQAFPHLTVEEVFFALEELEFHEDETLLQLTKSEFVRELRKKIAKLSSSFTAQEQISLEEVPTSELISAIESNEADSEQELRSESEDSEFDTEEGPAESAVKKPKIEAEAKKPAVKRKIEGEPTASKRPTKNYKNSQRLRLDEALSKADMEGWSSARVRAYQMLNQNPNTYYYRFNAPEETQRNGPWSPEEHEMFMKRLAECGADGQWGIFSMTIPGRVGYQCSNYYRKLIEAGTVSDPNYVLGYNGKAHYVGPKTRARTNQNDFEDVENEEFFANAEPMKVSVNTAEPVKIVESKPVKVAVKNTREKRSAKTLVAPNITLYEMPAAPPSSFDFDNPLPGFIDAITRMEVSKPAISPYGHVLSYDTWIRCLLNSDVKNICPITKQPLHKRQLTLLTHENIAEYRSSIIDLCNRSK